MSDDKKKDLTGIFDLPQSLEPEKEASDPFSENTEQKTEQVDSFESIDQIGMIDHETAPEMTEIIPEAPPTPEEVADAQSTTIHAIPEPLMEEESSHSHPLDEIKNYSEKTQIAAQEIRIHYPFHLYISGRFGPYERDKLLLFITENQVGVNSQDLDLQIKGGRVFFSRISEYAAIRLVQELRDSGLSFSLKPSDRDSDDATEKGVANHYQFETSTEPAPARTAIAVLPENHSIEGRYTEIDVLQNHQFVKAEMIEVERSDLLQDVIERMTNALKQKARARGGDALYRLTQTITPLRLPSQYQITIAAVVLKKNT